MSASINIAPRIIKQLLIHLYETSPSLALYRCGGTAFIGGFPIGKQSINAPHIEIFRQDSYLGKHVNDEFDLYWRKATKSVDLNTGHIINTENQQILEKL